MRRIQIETLPEFDKDLKNLKKRFHTLDGDLEVVKLDLDDEPGEHPPFSYQLQGLGIETCIIKVKKIACRALKGKGVNSGLRLIYAWFEEEQRIVFVELYYKGDKESEDRKRIIDNFF